MLVLLSFLAGVLTVLAPCVLPLIPIIIGGNLSETVSESRRVALRRTLVIISSLAISIFIFTLLLKATTALLGIPQAVWQWISGGIILLLGVYFLFPSVWQAIVLRTGLALGSQRSLGRASSAKGPWGLIATGAALGPVFTSCSPVYALILAVVFPSSWLLGSLYLLAYIAGICAVLGAVSYFGARLTRRFGWALNEHSIFRKIIGILFVLIGISIMFGFDKLAQAWLLERGFYDGTSGLERLFTQ